MATAINVLSIRCSLSFAPYLLETLSDFIETAAVQSRVVRQSGKGLILRSDGDVILRHEHRQAALAAVEAMHYLATVQCRAAIYDVLRMQDEVIFASIGCDLLLAHPQSEIWLDYQTVAALVGTYRSGVSESTADIPDWLKISMGGGRMLLSDQRSGRWVLLGADHLGELERRLEGLENDPIPNEHSKPPTISVKGITIHLQSAQTLASTMTDFVQGRDVTPFEETTPTYVLKVTISTEGLELSDSDNRISLNTREARKWADIIRAELERLHVQQIQRGRIRTVLASASDGRWILQWGDEVFVPGSIDLSSIRSSPEIFEGASRPIARRVGDFLVLTDYSKGDSVALNEFETSALIDWA
jgi:hypothetical protein